MASTVQTSRRMPDRRPRDLRRSWVARAAALVALVATLIALLVAVTTVSGSSSATTTTESRDLMLQLAQANGALGDRLNALAPGGSPRDAQDAGDGNLAAGLHAVFTAERDYLDAVGSTLNNPKSTLRGQVGPRAQALRDALQQVPGGDHHAVRGGQALVLYSEQRTGAGSD